MKDIFNGKMLLAETRSRYFKEGGYDLASTEAFEIGADLANEHAKAGKGPIDHEALADGYTWAMGIHLREVNPHKPYTYIPMKFQLGQFIYYRFELFQITKMDDQTGDNIDTVSNGTICTGGGRDMNEKCFRLSMDVKQVSDFTMHYYNLVKNSNRALNMPDIVRAFEIKWIQLAQLAEAQETTILEKKKNDLMDFASKIVEKVDQFTALEVEGIKLLRP